MVRIINIITIADYQLSNINHQIKRNIMSTVWLNNGLNWIEEKAFTPRFKQSRSITKISKIKTLNRPYHIQTSCLKMNDRKTLNVINFEAISSSSPMTPTKDIVQVRLSKLQSTFKYL